MVKGQRERGAPARLTYEAPAPRRKARKKSKSWEVERILKARTVKGETKYQLRWKGFSAKFDSWEPASNCACERLIKQFLKEKKKDAKAPAARKKKPAASLSRGAGKKAKAAAKAKKVTKKKSSTKSILPKGAISPSSMVLPTTVDAHAPVDTTGAAVLQEGTTCWSCMLKCVDMSQNMDKFYVLQVLQQGESAWLFTRWGRSGTVGQQECAEMPFDQAKKAFEKKFKEKTQFDWDSGAGLDQGRGRPGKYCPITVAASDDGDGKWEFYQDNYLDGKVPGWYPYAPEAVPTVEGVYIDWKNNPGQNLNVRCVQSGHFSYRIDFDQMKQTNLSTNKERPIRRV